MVRASMRGLASEWALDSGVLWAEKSATSWVLGSAVALGLLKDAVTAPVMGAAASGRALTYLRWAWAQAGCLGSPSALLLGSTSARALARVTAMASERG
jgi:hypothetical protein